MTLGPKKLVFVVDDNEDECILIKYAFTEERPDCILECFDSGRAILDRLNQSDGTNPDLILLDLLMPELDGLSVLSQIKESPALKSIPILIFTHSDSPSSLYVSYLSGSNSYLVKPTNFEDLKRHISVICKYWFDCVSVPTKFNMKRR
jgi:CheY-like chemotaxis protein